MHGLILHATRGRPQTDRELWRTETTPNSGTYCARAIVAAVSAGPSVSWGNLCPEDSAADYVARSRGSFAAIQLVEADRRASDEPSLICIGLWQPAGVCLNARYGMTLRRLTVMVD